MGNTEHDFCRIYLREIMKDVKPLTTVAERKAAWGFVGDIGMAW